MKRKITILLIIFLVLFCSCNFEVKEPKPEQPNNEVTASSNTLFIEIEHYLEICNILMLRLRLDFPNIENVTITENDGKIFFSYNNYNHSDTLTLNGNIILSGNNKDSFEFYNFLSTYNEGLFFQLNSKGKIETLNIDFFNDSTSITTREYKGTFSDNFTSDEIAFSETIIKDNNTTTVLSMLKDIIDKATLCAGRVNNSVYKDNKNNADTIGTQITNFNFIYSNTYFTLNNYNCTKISSLVSGTFEYKDGKINFKNVVVTPNDTNIAPYEISGTIKDEYKEIDNHDVRICTLSFLKYSTEKEGEDISYTIDGEYTEYFARLAPSIR